MVKIQKNRKGLTALWRRTAAVCGVLTLTASLLAGCGQQQNGETQSTAPAETESVSPEEQADRCRKVEEKFLAAGASAVLRNLSELPVYLEGLER